MGTERRDAGSSTATASMKRFSSSQPYRTECAWMKSYSTFPRGRRNGGYVVEGWLAKHPHVYSSTPFWVAIGTCAKPERSMPARRGLSIYSRRRDLQCLHEPGAGAGAGVGLPTYCKICRGVRCRLRNGWIGRRRERVPIPRYAVPHFFHGRSLRST